MKRFLIIMMVATLGLVATSCQEEDVAPVEVTMQEITIDALSGRTFVQTEHYVQETGEDLTGNIGREVRFLFNTSGQGYEFSEGGALGSVSRQVNIVSFTAHMNRLQYNLGQRPNLGNTTGAWFDEDNRLITVSASSIGTIYSVFE